MLRKFRVKINEKEYVVEMEELTPTVQTQPISQATAPQPTQSVTLPNPANDATVPAQPQPVEVKDNEGIAIESPMPGTILDIRVKVGDSVVENQVIAVLEAMKMENEIVAPRAGVITAIPATKGNPIDVGQPIVFIQ